MEKIYTPKQDYKVLVRCFTYNHSKYIEDALNGFVMQKTNFPFVCAIVDDCSTDGEQDVIKVYLDREFDMASAEHYETEYANIIKVTHKYNKNCTFCVFLLKFNHYSLKEPKAKYLKNWQDHCLYEAICEGDDYWIKEDKIQSQAKFLDNNPEYSFIFHSIIEKYEDRDYLNKVRAYVQDREYSGLEFFKTRPTQTSSFFYRTSVIKSTLYLDVVRKRKFVASDIPLALTCSKLGKLRGMSSVMSVYRRISTGWTESIKSDENYWRIINSQLEYQVFGKDFEQHSKYLFVLNCCTIFVTNIKKRRVIKWQYLNKALKYSVPVTIICLCKIFVENIKKICIKK